MLDAFIIEQLRREAEEKEREQWQPVPLNLEIEEDREPRKKIEENEPDRKSDCIIRF